MQKKKVKCILYLSTNCSLSLTARREDGQLRSMEKYASKHGYQIVKVVRRHGFNWNYVWNQFLEMAKYIRNKEAEVVMIMNTKAVSKNYMDTFTKAGLIQMAGGKLVSLDEGELCLNIKTREQEGGKWEDFKEVI